MASPQNSSLGKHANEIIEGCAETTLGTHNWIHTPQQDGEIHINFAITRTNLEAECWNSQWRYDLLDDIWCSSHQDYLAIIVAHTQPGHP